MPNFRGNRSGPPAGPDAQQIESNNNRRLLDISPMERRGADTIFMNKYYIYNISPIWNFVRNHLKLNQAPWYFYDETPKVSKPVVIPGAFLRKYDSDADTSKAYIMEGVDVARDFLGLNQQDQPADPTPQARKNALTLYGCFYTSKPFEELPAEERTNILETSKTAHIAIAREKVFEADAMSDNPKELMCINKFHRAAARFLREEPNHRWVIAQPSKPANTEECVFCGYDNKPGVVKCFNCKEVLDQTAYDALKGKNKQKQ
jgi:hypothetical protein